MGEVVETLLESSEKVGGGSGCKAPGAPDDKGAPGRVSRDI